MKGRREARRGPPGERARPAEQNRTGTERRGKRQIHGFSYLELDCPEGLLYRRTELPLAPCTHTFTQKKKFKSRHASAHSIHVHSYSAWRDPQTLYLNRGGVEHCSALPFSSSDRIHRLGLGGIFVIFQFRSIPRPLLFVSATTVHLVGAAQLFIWPWLCAQQA